MAERKRLTSPIAHAAAWSISAAPAENRIIPASLHKILLLFFFFFSSCHEKQKKNPTRLSLERVSWVFFGIYQLAASRLLKNQKVLDADIDEKFNEIN